MCSIDQVIEGLYLGDFTAAASIQTFQANQITHILIVAAGLPQHFPEQFVYKQIPVYDMPTCSIIDYIYALPSTTVGGTWRMQADCMGLKGQRPIGIRT
jgi:hypothetical protein